MSAAREVVLEQLTQLSPADAQVRPWARLNRQPARTTVLVRADEVEPLENADAYSRVYSFSLILLGTKLVTDKDETGGVDEEIDDLLEAVLGALDKGPTDLIWLNAKRGTYEATDSPCWIIDTRLAGIYESE